MVESGKIGVRQIGVIFSVFMFVGMSFGVMVDNARGDPVVTVSEEVMFYDHFWIADGLDKWTCHFDPLANKCEKAVNNPIGPHWNSWFLEKNGHLYLYSDPAYPTGEAWAESLPYSIVQDYVINLHFRLIADSYFKVVDDGYVLLTVEDDDLFAYEDMTKVLLQEDIGNNWNLIEIRVHLSAENYDIYLGRNWINNLNFARSSPLYKLVLGDDNDISVYPNMHGEGDWDNIIVAYLHPPTWSDDFDDGDIRDWTKVVSPPSFFDVWPWASKSPPNSLRMAQPGEVVYGFTPYYDIARNHDYTTQFWFRIPSGNSVELTVVADGNIRIILTGTTLSAYVSEIDIRQITSISMNEWHDIAVNVSLVSNTYLVTVDGTTILEYYPFVDETETEFIRATSQMFVGEHRHAYTGSEAFWDDMGVKSTNHPPTLTDGRVDPISGYVCITEFNYTVTYWDIDNDPPKTGYPSVNILQGGTPISGSPFVMKEVDSSDTNYVNGKDYYILIRLSAISPPDYSFYFEAYDIWDEYARDPVAPPDYPGPVVSIYTSEPWSMFHHDATHLGYTSSIAPDSAYICWISYLGGFSSGDAVSPLGVISVAVEDGRVFLVTKENALFAFNSVTGDFLWDYHISDLGKYNSLQPSPAAGYGRVYIGEYYGIYSPILYDPHRVFAIKVDGTLDWIKPDVFAVSSALTVADERVFVPTINVLWALDAYTGAVDWSYYEDVHGHLSSPVFKDGIVYVADMEGYIHAVWASGPLKGQQKWLYERVCGTRASVTVTDDMIYIGEEGPCPGQPGTGYRLNAIDLNKNLKWTYQTNGTIKSTAAVAYGRVYVLNDMGGLYAINTIEGLPAWVQYVGPGKSSPAVADGKVYVGDGFHDRLVCLDAYNGDIIWTYDGLPVGASSPAIADGMVYLPVPNSDLYAFG